MWRAFYAGLDFAWLPAATTVFFVAFFLAALLKLFVFSARKDFDQVSALPLDKENTR